MRRIRRTHPPRLPVHTGHMSGLHRASGTPDIDQSFESQLPGSRRPGRTGLAIVLASAMAMSMSPGPIIGIFSRFFIDDLGLTRTELGAVATGHAFVIMACSVPLGYLADRIGGRRMLVLMLGCVFLGLATMSLSWGLWSLIAFAGIAGLPAAGGNSATNNIIVDNVRAGSRGWITGTKQSGVQVGIFVAGAVLPVAAERLGWRQALALAALVAVAGIAVTLAVVPASSSARPTRQPVGSGTQMPRAVWWLSGYGITMGVGVAVYHAFIPLYVQEELGMTVGLAGTVIAASGATGALARILWGRIAERAGDPALPLVYIGILSVGSIALTWLATPATPLLVWGGAVLMGVGAGSWMSVGMLAVITLAGPQRTGRGTSFIMLGFGLGLTVGPVLFGWGVDASGSYDLPLAGTLLDFVASVVLMLGWKALTNRSAAPPSQVGA